MAEYQLNYYNHGDSVQIRIKHGIELVANIWIPSELVNRMRVARRSGCKFSANIFVPVAQSDNYREKAKKDFNMEIEDDTLEGLLFKIKVLIANSEYWSDDIMDFNPSLVYAEKFIVDETNLMKEEFNNRFTSLAKEIASKEKQGQV